MLHFVFSGENVPYTWNQWGSKDGTGYRDRSRGSCFCADHHDIFLGVVSRQDQVSK